MNSKGNVTITILVIVAFGIIVSIPLIREIASQVNQKVSTTNSTNYDNESHQNTASTFELTHSSTKNCNVDYITMGRAFTGSDTTTAYWNFSTPYFTWSGQGYGSGGDSGGAKVCTLASAGSCVTPFLASNVNQITNLDGVSNFYLCLYTSPSKGRFVMIANDSFLLTNCSEYVTSAVGVTPLGINYTEGAIWVANGTNQNYTQNFSGSLTANIAPFPPYMNYSHNVTVLGYNLPAGLKVVADSANYTTSECNVSLSDAFWTNSYWNVTYSESATTSTSPFDSSSFTILTLIILLSCIALAIWVLNNLEIINISKYF